MNRQALAELESWCDARPNRSFTIRRSRSQSKPCYVVELWQDAERVSDGSHTNVDAAICLALRSPVSKR